MGIVDPMERLRNAEKNFGTGAVIARAIEVQTQVLAEIELSVRALNTNLSKIMKIMENVDDDQ